MRFDGVARDVLDRTPTEREHRAWEALHEHKGVANAARALGLDPANVRGACREYMRKMGIEGPMPFVGTYTRRAGICPQHDRTIATLTEDNVRLERENAALLERIAALTIEAHPWTAVHAKLDALLKRPAGVTPITHRRIADGGTGGKKERRSQMSLSA